jgi:molybdenum cofactor cytidylyltransferase
MIAGILLAAGSATRFGSNKLLHLLPDGTPIALAAARNLKTAIPDCVAVVRPGARELTRLLREMGYRVVAATHAGKGMGHSLASGVRASREAHGWVVALADMPEIRSETIARVVRELQDGGAIVAPGYAGERGHPVGFARRFFQDLLALSGDEGARRLIAQYKDTLTVLELDDPGVLRDIDTRADLEEKQKP